MNAGPSSQTFALHGDVSRQAADSIRGYAFQIWHSVHAWLDLPPEEFLFLEGAEDIDIVSATKATTVQVKDTAANITLRSTSVVAAISHFWDLRGKHPDLKVRFRFLTRSGIGIEKGNPFGVGVAGLEIWKSCAKEPALIEKLRSFLLGEKKISSSVSFFLKNATADEILHGLIEPIAWDTKRSGIGYVEQAVHRQLAYHGERFGIPYSDAVSVANRLLKEALNTASKKDHRVLDHALFLQVFEEETTQRIPLQELRGLRDGRSGLNPRPSDPHSLEISKVGQLQTGIPRMPPNAAERAELRSDVGRILDDTGLLVLNGSSGMGKSTLAKIVAQTIAEPWIWLSLSGQNTVQTAESMSQLSTLLDKEKQLRNLIIDDIDLSPAASHRFEEKLGGLLYTLNERQGRVIITSQKALTGSLTRGLQADPNSSCIVPPFQEKEITHLASLLGCSKQTLSARWSKIVRLKTSGHPQLVHAHLLNLKRRQWPEPSVEDLIKMPTEVAQERSEKRQQLVDQLCAEEQELLFRLSLVLGPFRRDHAVAIAEQPSELKNGGAIFDRLVGPWIESAGDEYYRVSPLLQGAVSEVRSKQKVQELHASVSRAIIECEPITCIEASPLLFHGFLGKCVEVLVKVAATLPSAPREVIRFVAQSADWFTRLSLENGKTLFPDNHAVSVMLRALQFRLAAASTPKTAAKIAEAWEAEILPGIGGKSYPLERVMFASAILIHFEIDLPANKVIGLLKELMELEKKWPSTEAPFPLLSDQASDLESGLIDNFDTLAMMLVPRCKTITFLEDLLKGLDALKPAMRNRITKRICATSLLARGLTDRPWISESDQASPDWSRCIATYQGMAKLALKWNTPLIGVCAIRSIAIIYDEYLHQSALALRTLDKLIAETGFASVLLDDARGTVLFHQGKFADSLKIWETILPLWPEPVEKHDPLAIFACRIAAVSASRLGDWEKAARLFIDGHERAKTADNAEMAAGLLSDAAYAWWKSGHNKIAIETFVAALTESDLLSDSRENLGAFKVKRLVGHILYWIANTISGRSLAHTMPPQAGICSDPEPHKKLLELPDANPEGPWLLLGEIEDRLRTGVDVTTRIKKRLSTSSLPAAAMFIAHGEIATAFRLLDFDHLPSLCMNLTREFRVLREAHPDGELYRMGNSSTDPEAFQANDQTIGGDLFVDALVSLAGTNGIENSIFQSWRNDAEALPAREPLRKVFDLAEHMLTAEHSDAALNMRNEPSRIGRMLASLRVSTSSRATADQLFYADTILLDTLPHDGWIKECAGPLAGLFSNHWLEQCKFRMGLRSPLLTIPAIRDACQSKAEGLQKAAQILVAARHAVSVRLPDRILEDFNRLATGTGE